MFMLITVFCLVLTVLQAQATTYYVAPPALGGAPPPGRTCAQATNLATPLSLPHDGVQCLVQGDTLYIRQGTYDSKILYRIHAVGTTMTTIAGYPGDAPPMLRPLSQDVNFPYVIGVFAQPGTIIQQNAYVTIQGIDVDAINLHPESLCFMAGMGHGVIDGVRCYNANRTAFFFSGLPNTSGEAHHWEMKNSLVKDAGRIPFNGYDTKGPALYTAASHLWIHHNVFDGNRGGCIDINYAGNEFNVYEHNICSRTGASSPWGPVPPTYTCNSPNPGDTCPRETLGLGIAIGGQGRAICGWDSVNPFPPAWAAGKCPCPWGTGAQCDYHPRNAWGPSNNIIRNNILYDITGAPGPGGPGIARCLDWWGTSPPVGQENLFYHNTCDLEANGNPYGGYGVALRAIEGSSNQILRNNLATNAPNPNLLGGLLSATYSNNLGIQDSDPQPTAAATYLDQPHKNYRLKTGSPAVDTGFNLGAAVTTSFYDDVPRPFPVGGAFDIGAAELGTAVPPPPPECVAEYLLDGTALDTSGKGNHVTLQGSPAYVAGLYGQALSLNGTSQYATAADHTSLDLGATMTMAAWVNPSAAPTGFQALVVKDYVYFLYASTSTYCGPNAPVGGLYDGVTAHVVCDPTALPANTWTHLAVTYGGTALRLFRDGLLVATSPVTGPIPTSNNPLYLGASSFGEYFAGRLDTVDVCNYVLTDAEMLALAARPPGPASAPPVLTITTPSATVTVSPQTLTGTATDETGVVSLSASCTPPCGSPPVVCTPACSATATSVAWSVSVPLQEGANVVTIHATDDVPQTTTGQRTLTLLVPTATNAAVPAFGLPHLQ